MSDATSNVLSIRDLKTYFFLDEGTVRAVDGVNLEVPKGKTIGIVGESGCGKSVSAFSTLRLVTSPGEIVEGESAEAAGRNPAAKVKRSPASATHAACCRVAAGSAVALMPSSSALPPLLSSAPASSDSHKLKLMHVGDC